MSVGGGGCKLKINNSKADVLFIIWLHVSQQYMRVNGLPRVPTLFHGNQKGLNIII